MWEVSYYRGEVLFCRSVYERSKTALRMVAWLQEIDPSVRVVIRKVSAYGNKIYRAKNK